MSKIHFTATDAELDEFSVDKRPVQFEGNYSLTGTSNTID